MYVYCISVLLVYIKSVELCQLSTFLPMGIEIVLYPSCSAILYSVMLIYSNTEEWENMPCIHLGMNVNYLI